MSKKNKKYLWKYAAVVGLLIFLFLFKASSLFEGYFSRVVNPILKPLYSLTAKLRIKFDEQTSKEDLNFQVKKLNEERNSLIEANSKLQLLEEENNVLRDQLGFLTRNKHHYVTSNVISRGDLADSSQISETIIIDKGLHDGIYNGLGVVSGNGIIVGKIVDTKDEIAKIYLTNNPNCKLATTILGDSKTSGIVEGELGLTMKMNFIPQTANLKKDDVVVTSGLEENIPRGLVVGKVAEVKGESNDPWQSAVIEPLVNPDDLIIISVILP